MAVCRKSSDATNVRWAPCVPDQGPDQGQLPRIFNRLRDFRGFVPGSTRRDLSRRFGPRSQGCRPAIRAGSASASARSASAGSGPAGSGAALGPFLSISWSASSSEANRNWRASDRVPRPASASRLLPSTRRGGGAQAVFLALAAGDLVGPAGDRQVDQPSAIRRPPRGSARRAPRPLRGPWREAPRRGPGRRAGGRRARARSARAPARRGRALKEAAVIHRDSRYATSLIPGKH